MRTALVALFLMFGSQRRLKFRYMGIERLITQPLKGFDWSPILGLIMIF